MWFGLYSSLKEAPQIGGCVFYKQPTNIPQQILATGSLEMFMQLGHNIVEQKPNISTTPRSFNYS